MNEWLDERREFLTFLREWMTSLPEMSMSNIVREAGGPEKVAIICVDVTVGFCREGRLASPRVAGIVRPIAELFRAAHSCGVTSFVLSQDQHPADSPEFEAYGPHSVVGSAEAQTMPELTSLPFSDLFLLLPKQSINPAVDTEYPDWLDRHTGIRRFIVVGDVTDICVHQIAVHLMARKNQFRMDYEVIVPMNCVDTWDMPVTQGRQLGVNPHDAELFHALFLYHMHMNNVRVARKII